MFYANQVTVPRDSLRWSLNIGCGAHGNWEDVLFHFNPRREKRKNRHQLILNDKKESKWGLIEAIVIDDSLLFGRTFEIIIQVPVMLWNLFFPVADQLCRFFPTDILLL